MTPKQWLILPLTAVLAVGVTACGGDDDENGGGNGGVSGTIRADGSSTVAPLTETAAELFQGANRNVRVTVGTSGTSGGFEKFCNGETDISNASRPIKDEEIAACDEGGVEYDEIQVANDALSVVVNPENPLECITTAQLKAIWDRGSNVDSWADVEGLDADIGDERLTLFGAGSDSGTYDYWTEAINEEEGRIRTDYNSIGEDDNAAINGVGGDQWAMAFVPHSFVTEAAGQVKPLAVDGGEGCVEASAETVQDGSYTPLGRPLFIYPSAEALQRPEVLAFIEFYLEDQEQITSQASYIPMNDEQLSEAQDRVAALAGGS